MTQKDFFKEAKWVGAADRGQSDFAVLRGKFQLEGYDKVTVNALGLGVFWLYINGTLINPDTFLPLNSDFEASADPKDEVLTAHRIYVPTFDITPFVRIGENSVVIHFGGGWYPHKWRRFGSVKAIYCITATIGGKKTFFVSDENCRIGRSYITESSMTAFERHNYTDFDFACFGNDFDDSNWERSIVTEQIDTIYDTTDCPTDALIETIIPRVVKKTDTGVIYDISKNVSCVPVIKVNGGKAEYHISEELTADNELDLTHNHKQALYVDAGDRELVCNLAFAWHCGRYIKVEGNTTLECVKVIYSDIKVNSKFNCDNETLNWIYNTFVNSMLCNMHQGIPSDCPHIERRGYTGDGQATCNAALTVLGAKEFYKKWMQDISDCQDVKSGHIQYTAPYIRSGGGPGGWGCAIVEVPWQYYLHFGDKSVLEKYYTQMRRYIDYLEAHSEFSLVTSDKEGEWCLGDWCGPVILYRDKDITNHNQQVMLPAPMVNTYFMVKSLNTMIKIASVIGKIQDIPEYEEKVAERKKAINAAYFNTFDGNFVMNVQGANCYAVDLGLGSDKTYKNMVDYYKKLGHYDTGIFATDILTRVLFEKGNPELAVKLLTSDGEYGFENWRRNGATTFHEYWDSNRSRSHCHHMFGAVTAYLFEYLLGIKQEAGTAGYTSLVIEPLAFTMFNNMSGSIETPNGTVSVSYERKDDHYEFEVTIPENVKAVFKLNCEVTHELTNGDNSVIVLV